jgi:hypothetical protein
MDIKQILVIFGCSLVTIIVSIATWHLFKWLVTEGLLIGAAKRLLKITVVSTLIVVCFGIYLFIGCYSIKNERYKDIVSAITEAWKSELGFIKVTNEQRPTVAMD